MSEIKIHNLKTDAENSAEMIDLRGDAAVSNSKAFTAFTTLRGGMMSVKSTCWACWS